MSGCSRSRTPRSITPDFSAHARTLIEQYELDAAGGALLTRASGVAEVVIPPRSELVGERVFAGHGHRQRRPRRPRRAAPRRGLAGDTALAVGDTLLLQGTWAALDEHSTDPTVLVVDPPELVRRQAVPLGAGAKRALVVLVAMVVLLATGAVPPAVAGLLAAGAMVLSACSRSSRPTAASRGRR